MKHRFRSTMAASLAAAITGCSFNMNPTTWWSGPVEQSSAQLAGAARYQCEGNKNFAVRYGAAGQAAMVILPDREFRMDPVPGATDARYSNGRNTLYTKGDQVFMDEGSANVFAGCKRIAAAP